MTMSDGAPEGKEFQASWEEIHALCDALADRLKGAGPLPGGAWAGIVAVARGGLVPAGLLARALEIRRIDTLCVASYDGKICGDSDILKRPDAAGDGAGWIVVDDLADSGRTFVSAREVLPGAVFACVYAKPQGAPHADLFVRSMPQGTWIVFPWERAADRAAGES